MGYILGALGAILLSLLALGYAASGLHSGFTKSNVASMEENMIILRMQTQQFFNGTNYDGLSNEVAIKAGIVPEAFIKGDQLRNSWGGDITLANASESALNSYTGVTNVLGKLTAYANNLGSTSELGIYEMCQDGLRQVSNPSELLLTQDHEGLSGVAISSAIEGVRPFLVETQALVSSAAYGTPQRSATGFDQRRLNMLLAVLEKRVGFKLMQKDVFLNIAGGLRVTDMAMDLSVIAAVLSSNVDTAIESGWCMAGEVGLSGEVRPVSRIEQRIAEAEKLGFSHIIIPKYNMQGISRKKFNIDLVPVRKVEEALRALFG